MHSRAGPLIWLDADFFLRHRCAHIRSNLSGHVPGPLTARGRSLPHVPHKEGRQKWISNP